LKIPPEPTSVSKLAPVMTNTTMQCQVHMYVRQVETKHQPYLINLT